MSSNEDSREFNVTGPLLAAIGAGDALLGALSEFAGKARKRAEDDLRGVEALTPEALRDKLADFAEETVDRASALYRELTERGEAAVDRVREHPTTQKVRGNKTVAEQMDKAEAAFNDVVELTEEALGTVARQTRSLGEQAVRRADAAKKAASGKTGAGKAAGEKASKPSTAKRPEPKKPAAKKAPSKRVDGKK